jgi:3-hydroxymyristoyl/3-hydroxydecanoyl-(acyl carrier protein) dehydratase
METGTTASGGESRHVAALAFPADHPSIPGHFPGNPVVAGVLLIDSIVAVAESWFGRPVRVTCLPQVKFQTPLRPGQEVRLDLRFADPRLEFTVTLGAATVASGRLIIDGPPARE